MRYKPNLPEMQKYQSYEYYTVIPKFLLNKFIHLLNTTMEIF